MLKEGKRHVLITEKAPVIRNALSALLAGVKSEGDVTPGTREKLEAFAKQGCDRLVLDLRTVKEAPGGIASGVRNLRASQLGPVLVVTGEVAAPHILQEIEALRRHHPFPKHVATGLLAFVHMFFLVSWW